ncbi:hypothetical protein [Paractinoplanes toevensis]|nr:hypothetical protein [Actinoplanes toevensis]
MSIALFFLSPLVAEFLLGDFTLAQLPFLFLLAPAYGGAAIVIRELTRRTGRGWPTILLLALAYGVLEEGLETQSLFNPDYAHAHLLEHGFVPSLGISIPWTLFVLAIHTIFSMSVPIALVEEWTSRRTEPWLRTRGFAVAIGLAVLGAAGTFAVSYADGHFMARPAQLAVTVVVVVLLVVAAFRVPARLGAQDGPVPSPWLVLIVALAGGGVLSAIDPLPWGIGVPVVLAVLAAIVVAVVRWSRRPGWDGRHRLALAAGGLLTYAWHSFTMNPVIDAPESLILVSHVVFALAAVLLLVLEARHVITREGRTPAGAGVVTLRSYDLGE